MRHLMTWGMLNTYGIFEEEFETLHGAMNMMNIMEQTGWEFVYKNSEGIIYKII